MAQDSARSKPVLLHVIHGLGGGSERWLADFCAADPDHTHLVLRPLATSRAMANGVALYAGPLDEAPVKAWTFQRPIAATAVAHPEYRAALDEVMSSQGVGALMVSSLIGHSLEVMDTGVPTVFVCHDYYPWCPAINLYFGEVCGQCDGARLARCASENPDYNPFENFGAEERAQLRERFVEAVRKPHVRVVAPSASVGRNLKRLEPRFADLQVTVIEHGYGKPLPHVDLGTSDPGRLRLLVLGQLSRAKGQQLFEAALPRIATFADVTLLGCRELGELYKFDRRVRVVADYQMSELPSHIAAIRPHAALLMSVVEETFSYVLSEVWMMGVPAVATRLGSFADRIREGENGFLYDPTPDALVETLRRLDADRAAIDRVRANLASFSHRSSTDMAADYRRLLPTGPAPDAVPPTVTAASPADGRSAQEVATVASMWRHIRKLDLELGIVNDARHRAEMTLLTEGESRRRLEERLQRVSSALSDREARLLKKEMLADDLAKQVAALKYTLAQVKSSTSWRLTRPVRAVGMLRRKLRVLAAVAAAIARDPGSARRRLGAVKRAVMWGRWEALEHGLNPSSDWLDYRRRFESEVVPRLVAQDAALPRRPLVSIIVPVYNPSREMFRAMLESVCAQIYKDWELCLADDASTAPHVRELMEEYAARDKRIRPSYAEANGGVSRASNRALAMAGGEFVILCDHDDLLEEQAVLRFAQAVVEDDPDMAYSDEILVGERPDAVLRYAYRPAFSPEYLRAHPYIVHMVGFRTALLRELGGWNEDLSISQDYDLILRASEKAQRIAHIPEILYRWRIHGASAGTARKAQVMDVSKGVLGRHLERIGRAGRVEEGHGFNFFDARHPLEPGLKVAVIIPTKNGVALLRQCIESLRRTVKSVAYHVLVIDHESDDPATIAYMASLVPEATVARYEGPFNFAAINNFAVAQLGQGYTHYLLCNNDIEAREPGWLERMLELGQQPDVGIVGAQLLYPDKKTVQHAGVCVGMFGAAEHYGKNARMSGDPIEPGFGELLVTPHEVAAVTAACLLIRADTWHEVGGFDESIAVGFGDVDLCLRVLEAGFRIVYCPAASLIHHESATRGVSEIDPHPADSAQYRMKWRGFIEAGDPYYSPGLSPNSTRWDIRRPLPVYVDAIRRVWRRDPDTGRQRISTGGIDATLARAE